MKHHNFKQWNKHINAHKIFKSPDLSAEMLTVCWRLDLFKGYSSV